MKTLVMQVNAVKSAKTDEKRDFLLDVLMMKLHKQVRNYWAFKENVSDPFKQLPPTEGMSNLIDGIFGFYLYSQNRNEDPKETILHDINGYLRLTAKSKEFKPKTRNFGCYLKYK
jgi:hypothetical protein